MDRIILLAIALLVFVGPAVTPERADARLPLAAKKKVPAKGARFKQRSRPTWTIAAPVRPVKPEAAVRRPVEALTSRESLEAELDLPADGAWRSMEKAALSLLGKRYRFGGEGRDGIDCSAFVRKVYDHLKIPLPRTAREQFSLGDRVPLTELRKGDLLFFRTYRQDASHVGIYMGNDRMIHASSGGSRVMISSINGSYFQARFLGARRLVGEGEESAAPVRRTGSPLLADII